MSLTQFAIYLISSIEELVASCIEAQRDRARAEAAQQLLKQLLALLARLAQLPATEELGEAVHARLRTVLAQLSGETLLTVLIAEYLRAQLQILEFSAHELEQASRETGQHGDRGCGKRAPDERPATAVIEETGILASKLQAIHSDCAVLPLIIPSPLAALATRLQVAGALIADALHGVANRSVVVNEEKAVALALSGANCFRYRTYGRKAHALRCATHQLGGDLRNSLGRLRREIDGAQRNGEYDPTTLAAVSEGLRVLAAKTLTSSEFVVARANAPVRLFGKRT